MSKSKRVHILTAVNAANVSKSDVMKYLRYEPLTGRLIRLVGSGKHLAGLEAGTVDRNGYRYVNVNRKRLAAHRVAWLLTHGEWPAGEIDHINGHTDDNRLENLRVVDRVTNTQNRHAAQTNNLSSGVIGVTWHKRASKWQAQIKVGTKQRYLGLFESVASAAAAYLSVKRSEHAGCTI